jgi:uncharacterized protein (TIGR03663 family)
MRLSVRRLAACAVLVLGIAAALRVAWLERRPPHHDEGVNGWFAEQVVRDGYYRYDPTNYHGTTHFYLLAASHELFGHGLWQLRLPTVVAGILLCGIPLLVRRRLGDGPALAGALVLATSPVLVYFARDAIHETSLVLLTLLAVVSLAAWLDGGRPRALGLAVAALALALDVKETIVLLLPPLGLVVALEVIIARRAGRRLALRWPRLPGALAWIAALALVHVVLLTGAFRDPAGVVDALRRSLATYLAWLETGTDHGGHVKPATYYLGLMVRYEAVLVGLAVLGAITGRRRPVVRAAAVAGLALALEYSAIPYKMPWLAASWIALLALPAGQGLAWLAGRLHGRGGVPLAAVPVVVATAVAGAITIRSSLVQPADHREDLAYVQTDAAYHTWLEVLVRAGAHGVIAVDLPSPWPLPWTLAHREVTWLPRTDAVALVAPASRRAALAATLRGGHVVARFPFRAHAEDVDVYVRLRRFRELAAELPPHVAAAFAPLDVEVAAR